MFNHFARAAGARQVWRVLRVPLMVAGVVLAFTACHSTVLATTWSDPAGRIEQSNRTVAVFVTSDAVMRRSIEDLIAEHFPNTIPSYRVLDSTTASRPAIAHQLRDAGFGNALVMRLVRVDQNVTYQPGYYWYGSPYTFSGYWTYAWADPWNPVAYVDQVVVIDSEIYSLRDEKLVFAARSETTNPASTHKLVESVVRHVTKQMQDQGLLR